MVYFTTVLNNHHVFSKNMVFWLPATGKSVGDMFLHWMTSQSTSVLSDSSNKTRPQQAVNLQKTALKLSLNECECLGDIPRTNVWKEIGSIGLREGQYEMLRKYSRRDQLWSCEDIRRKDWQKTPSTGMRAMCKRTWQITRHELCCWVAFRSLNGLCCKISDFQTSYWKSSWNI